MKQQIICQKCEAYERQQFPMENPYPGEHVKFVKGTAIDAMICDLCGKSLNAWEQVCAFSIWADHGGQPYYEWEFDYIESLK